MPTPPSFSKVNPADSPILFLALTSRRCRSPRSTNTRETLIAQRISTVNGVAQVQVFGAQKYAVRVQLDPERARRARHRHRRGRSRRSRSATSTCRPARCTASTARSPCRRPASSTTPPAFRPLIVAYRNGAPVRLSDLGRVIDSVQNDKVATWFNGKRGIILAIQRQPGTNTDRSRRLRSRSCCPAFRAQLPPAINIDVSTTARCRSATRSTTCSSPCCSRSASW